MWDPGGTRGTSSFVLPSGWMTRIGNADSVEVLQAVADDLAARIGFGSVTYTQHLPHDPDRIPLFFSRYPDDWVNHYSSNHFGAVDPVIRLAKLGRPFSWRDIPDRYQGDDGRHVLNTARDFGIIDGFCVPVLGGPVIGALNALPVGSAREREEALRYGVESLVALGHLVHERARLLTMRQARDIVGALTPMESEMVQRLMTGVSEDQVVGAMRLGEGEFRRLLGSVMGKLGATDPHQLRARTALLGLADPP